MLFSIILPTYNSSNFILDTINCILNQTYNNFELLIIDDFSSDNTHSILLEYQKIDNRIKVFKNPSNFGVSFSRNYGIEKAIGDYLIFWDSDDIASPDRLYLQSQIIKDKSIDVFYSNYHIIDTFGNILFKKKAISKLNIYNFYIENPIPNLTALIKRESIGNFRFRINVKHEDSIFYFDLFKSGLKFKKVSLQDHFYYRYHSNSLSGKKYESLRWRYFNLRNDFNLTITKAVLFYSIYFFKNLIKYSILKLRFMLIGLFFIPLKIKNGDTIDW
jgi:glycosyltransferase involved in cell wall biosynthesis